MRKIILFVIGLLLLLSCNQKTSYKDSNFIFQLPKKEVFVKTSKQAGGKFVIFFALDSLSLDNKLDSVEFETGGYIYILVDTTNVYIKTYASPIQKIKCSNFNIKAISDRDSEPFFENGIQKDPYSYIHIATREYHMFVNQQEIKKGNIYGE